MKLACLFTIVIGSTACLGRPGYEADLRALEHELSERATVTRVQEWLAQHGPVRRSLDDAQWPDSIRALQPLRVVEAECGGVEIIVRRGDLYAVVVCPPGTRPALAFHEPSMERPGYLGPLGSDAYIVMTER